MGKTKYEKKRRKKGKRRSRMGREAEEKKKKKKKERQGVQDLNLGYSILFEGFEYIYIYIYIKNFVLHFFKELKHFF